MDAEWLQCFGRSTHCAAVELSLLIDADVWNQCVPCSGLLIVFGLGVLIGALLLMDGLEIKDISGFSTNVWAAAFPKLLSTDDGILTL